MVSAALIPCCLSPAFASSAQDDFAHGIPLETEPGHTVYALTVPERVYAGVKRPGLGDLRVFDAAGAAMQHALCTREPAAEWVWLIAAPGSAAPEEQNTHLFRIGSLAPIAQAQLGLPAANLRLKVSISSRDADNADWQQRATGWFSPVQDKDSADALPSGFEPAHARQWRVQVLEGAEALGGRDLALRLGYQPAELRFLAQGEPPYQLAYGSAQLEPAPLLGCAALPAPTGMARALEPWDIASAALRGEPALDEPAPSPSRKIVFGSLLAGAGMLGALAVTLILLRRRRREPDLKG